MNIPRATLEEVMKYLYGRGAHHRFGYNHLTTWENFGKMMTKVKAPGGGQHRMLHLGAALGMNDADDRRCGPGVYFISFTWGIEENISMWTNYGIPNREAVRINFTEASVRQWLRDYKAGKIGVYGVKADGSLEVIEKRPKVWMVDVAYWSKYLKLGKEHEAKRKDKNAGILKHDTRQWVITEPKNWREGLESGRLGPLTVYFKDAGWAYEREARLALVFEGVEANEYPKIAVDFDDPFGEVEANFHDQVIRGPWYKDEKLSMIAGHTVMDCRESLYSDKLRMRSVCNVCKEKDRKNCKCPFRGQR